jgi:hypothetical protein
VDVQHPGGHVVRKDLVEASKFCTPPDERQPSSLIDHRGEVRHRLLAAPAPT